MCHSAVADKMSQNTDDFIIKIYACFMVFYYLCKVFNAKYLFIFLKLNYDEGI